MSITDVFFPAEPRSFRGRRGFKIGLRAVHVLCAGLLTGSHWFGADPSLQTRWLAFTALTGSALLLLDLHESGVFLLQIRGYLVLVKLVSLGFLPGLEPVQASWLLAILFVVSVLSSHAPSRVRYAVLLGGSSFRGARTKG